MPVGRELALNLAETLARNWWVLLLRGVAAIAFGILTFAWPGISLASLVLVFGAFCLADGVMAAWTALTTRKQLENRCLLLIGGALGVGVGLVTLFQPDVTAVVLLFYIAVWAIATGVVQLITAVRLRAGIEDEWMLALAGLASLGFGALLLLRPGAGALGVLGLIGGYAVVLGALLVALALEVRAAARRIAARLA